MIMSKKPINNETTKISTKKLMIDTTKINRIKVNRTISELKSSHLLDEKIVNDLFSSEANTPQFKMLPKVYKREILVDQWSF